MHVITMLTLVGAALVLATSGEGPSPTVTHAKEVQKRLAASLMSIPSVKLVGVGESKGGQPTIKVFVEEGTPEVEGQIPEQIEGIKVEVERTDPISIQPESAEGNTPG
jgi:hypothetical protein